VTLLAAALSVGFRARSPLRTASADTTRDSGELSSFRSFKLQRCEREANTTVPRAIRSIV
jgi:hypothetical protein